ncbi:MAG: calcium/sodium antiporter [Gammaproteobacteria bacterium]|nr:MAG: calcium/sodium antiporter [Gammaproteobacteria bacterium]
MLTVSLAIILGLIFLVWSADQFVDGAASLATNANISKFVIGLTVVAFGTSAPEILVSITASLSGSPEIAIGNAIGSNIANIGLVLGVTALIAPIVISKENLAQDLPILIVVTIVCGILLLDYDLDLIDGLILSGLFLLFIAFLAKFKFKKNDQVTDLPDEAHDTEASQPTEADEPPTSNLSALGKTALGLVVLIISSKSLVWGASELALSLGISKTLIGLTLVSVGTSLPELAAAIASALKNHTELAIGNVIGSNIFNLLTVLPLPALLAPGAITANILDRDYLVMLFLTFMVLALAFIGKSPRITAIKGILLLAVYTGYYVMLYQTEFLASV